jgi:electron transport complex protein RnfC
MVKLRENKEYTEHKPISKAGIPPRVYIPLAQHFGKPCAPLVKLKDRVRTGQLIAAADSGLYSPIHASVSGTVVAIQDYAHPVLGKQKAIVIESDNLPEEDIFKLKPEEEVNRLSGEEIKKMVFEAGIVGLGGAAFPAYVKLSPPKPIKHLVINGAECEPYLTSDSRLMVESAGEIIKGAQLIAKTLQNPECIIAIEDNKPEAIESINKAIQGTAFRLKVLKTQYPQGGEKQLVQSVLKKEVPSGGLPFDIGVVVQNVGTAFAVYEAVYKGKPLYERVVTLTGSILSNPGNFLVRIGTPAGFLLEKCGPLKEEAAKMVFGGPMMGIAQYTLDVPVIKGTSGIIFFSSKEINRREERVCCRCGRCIDVCPARIMPALIGMAAEKERWDIAATYDVFDCIECGLCSYICPAKRDLVHLIKYAKTRVKK